MHIHSLASVITSWNDYYSAPHCVCARRPHVGFRTTEKIVLWFLRWFLSDSISFKSLNWEAAAWCWWFKWKWHWTDIQAACVTGEERRGRGCKKKQKVREDEGDRRSQVGKRWADEITPAGLLALAASSSVMSHNIPQGSARNKEWVNLTYQSFFSPTLLLLLLCLSLTAPRFISSCLKDGKWIESLDIVRH